MSRMRTIATWYDRLEEGLPMLFFLLIFGLMTVGVFLRYLFGFSFAWNVELVRYSFVWLTFAGAAYVRRTGSHIKIEIIFVALDRVLPPAGRMIVWAIKELLILTFLILLIVLSRELADRSRAFMSQAMQLSQYYLYISVAVGAIMFMLREIPDAVRTFRKGFDEPAKLTF